ncbi:MAG: transcription initiation factor IIB [Nitrosopumilus sp.]|uniref:transcription initiation factor IIB n=1 Tax=Nitrosopumilus sp. TaxID=2024843 RepID=UPI00292CEE0B|nr:TFIIB-type zinc ribbon-containing protein [Nitrosopumilus sp.]
MTQKYISDKEKRLSSCDESTLITDFETGEIFCSNCGHVLSERAEYSGPEWSSFSHDKINDTGTGSRTSLAKHDQGLSTIINTADKDVSGRPLSTTMKKTLKQLRILDRQSQIRTSGDRNFIQAFGKLHGLKDKLALSNIIMEKAAYIYRKAVEKKLVQGRTISAMIAASLYAACRDTKTPRTLKDIAQASNIRRKEIAVCYRLIFQELELKMPVIDSIQCIARISSRLEITEKTKRHAVKVLKQAQEHKETAGKDPMGLAAAALYLSCAKNGEYKTQRQIASAANVTEVTVRNRVKSFKLDQNLKL